MTAVIILACIGCCIYGCCTEDESQKNKPIIETYIFDKDEETASKNESQNPLYDVRSNSTQGNDETKTETVA